MKETVANILLGITLLAIGSIAYHLLYTGSIWMVFTSVICSLSFGTMFVKFEEFVSETSEETIEEKTSNNGEEHYFVE